MGGDPRRPLMGLSISAASSVPPPPPHLQGDSRYKRRVGQTGRRESRGNMDAGRLAVLLVLVLVLVGRGQAEGPESSREGVRDHLFMEEENGPPPRLDAQAPAALLRSLLQSMQRPGRSSAFLFQPQRFGRDARRSPGRQWLSPQAGEGPNPLFWSLAAPQRFGKK
ncbi:pro-FMRFamide-related neuropeptide FF [Trichosurus vulpecula]|uniref:pro-FMRFamide-related neuropeptide FF n=1 Tax=Trichosurus vulpecula TaxID=9337 RepID=UPI00186ADF56|nr:pro-FMRFamide-related neuropeptide FF [Trichosurus vulpecula]